MKLNLKKRFNCAKMQIAILFLLVIIAVLSSIVIAPPSPHNIDGRVLNNNSGNGVENGIPVLINDTVSGDIILIEVNAPLPLL